MARSGAKDDAYVVSHSTKFLARATTERRHDFGQYAPDDARARYCEPWRFPIVDTHGPAEGEDRAAAYALNDVTFVYHDADGQEPAEVGVVGTFAGLHQVTPLRRVGLPEGPSPYWAATVVVPKAQVHRYLFRLDGRLLRDPVNPQAVTMDNGRQWSRFFTDACALPLVLDEGERALLDRLTDHILPFRTSSGRRFLSDHYAELDRSEPAFVHAYRLDESVGVVNYIDKLLARQESHYLDDYRVCLRQIDRLLRARNPYSEPARMGREMFEQLYGELGSGSVTGWDYDAYAQPQFFLSLLRRHTFTGAFSHPKYGGNSAAAGWAYLQELLRDEQGNTLFNWRRAIEAPLGDNVDYVG
ncbi:MAG TPA: gluconate 2-dehydrogenase subunit 3 family protein [Egibacteraceae bacterium]|nr:gluconate 2-dehydrogenase subunit 3 family protein [Egibacteraceae bacterium]